MNGSIDATPGGAAGVTDPQWLFLAYKVPSEPSSNRILIWRELKHMGAYYPQQAVCILPGRETIRSQIGKIRAKVKEMGGTDTYLEIPFLPEEQHNELVEVFIDLAARQYGEIVEECEEKFIKQIEFARFRENYTFEEAEEILQDLSKIQRWFHDVSARDWFQCPERGEAERWMKECETALEAFETEVYTRTEGSDEQG